MFVFSSFNSKTIPISKQAILVHPQALKLSIQVKVTAVHSIQQNMRIAFMVSHWVHSLVVQIFCMFCKPLSVIYPFRFTLCQIKCVNQTNWFQIIWIPRTKLPDCSRTGVGANWIQSPMRAWPWRDTQTCSLILHLTRLARGITGNHPNHGVNLAVICFSFV